MRPSPRSRCQKCYFIISNNDGDDIVLKLFEAHTFGQIAAHSLQGTIVLLVFRLRVLVHAVPLIAIVLLSIAIIGWPILLAGLWDQFRGAMTSPWLRGVALAGLLILGRLLYYARERMQSVYGVVEVCIGAAACWAGLGHTQVSGFASGITLAGGIYVIVRGLDNFFKGYAADKARTAESLQLAGQSMKHAVVGPNKPPPPKSRTRVFIEELIAHSIRDRPDHQMPAEAGQKPTGDSLERPFADLPTA